MQEGKSELFGEAPYTVLENSRKATSALALVSYAGALAELDKQLANYLMQNIDNPPQKKELIELSEKLHRLFDAINSGDVPRKQDIENRHPSIWQSDAPFSDN